MCNVQQQPRKVAIFNYKGQVNENRSRSRRISPLRSLFSTPIFSARHAPCGNGGPGVIWPQNACTMHRARNALESIPRSERADSRSSRAVGLPGIWPAASKWYNSHIRCGSVSTPEKADASAQIHGAGSGSKRRRGVLSAILARPAVGCSRAVSSRLLGARPFCALSFLKYAKTKKVRFCTS